MSTHGKQLKSLTLPRSIAKELEEFASKTGCKQADIVKVAICELLKLDEQELKRILVKYYIL